MTYFSSLLKTNPKYKPSAERLFSALDSHGIQYSFLDNTRDIWLRDFMPIRTKSGKYVSFRYEPSYLNDYPHLKTDFRKNISGQLALESIIYSDINLDGGNVVFSPSKTKAVISDRVFMENFNYSSAELVQELERLLEAQVIIIPSLRSDMTGHADGMVRFVDESTAVGNASHSLFGLEAHIKTALRNHGIEVYDFPYFDSKGISAIGCYLNFLETESHLFLPVFDADLDKEAISTAKSVFKKTIVPVNINEIAADGGVLNCISWEK
ncbi:MAG: agmatine deiminase family protein [Oscillospiraceae bacterium]|nr:agmatine deiminase family protein [Oscillospiraceae bacterium]